MAGGRTRSATFDEPLHLTAGYAALASGDYRMDISHPPLVRMWASLPLAAGGHPPADLARIDGTPSTTWLSTQRASEVARGFLYATGDADRVLNRARFMIVLLAAALGLLVFSWTYEWLGLRAALFALLCFSLSPNMLAHGSLVTTDLGETTFFFGACYFLWRTARRASWGNAIALAVLVAGAVLAKFSGMLLGPLVVVMLGIAVWNRSITLRTASSVVALVAATTFAAVWAAYGFRYAPSPTPDWTFHLHEELAAQQVAPLASAIVAWSDRLHLLPNAFSQGLLFCLESSVQPAYLLGRYSAAGWWYYFPVAFLVKTPISLLVLLIAGVVVQVRWRQQIGTFNSLFVSLPVALVLLTAMSSGINIGLRHILAVYPFVFLTAAAAADRWIGAARWSGRLALASALTVWIISLAAVYPHTLTFFNRAAGGPSRGLAWLADSNLDWGQHLGSLKSWMDDRGVTHINLAYFGPTDPRYYGIECTYLPSGTWLAPRVDSPPRLPGFVAISATVLSGVYLPPEWRLFYQAFQDQRPIATIGNSIYVYWVDEWPASPSTVPVSLTAERDLATALQQRMHWPKRSIRHYQEYLRRAPRDPLATQRLGLAQLAAGDPDAALATLRRAIELDPSNFTASANLAIVLLQRGEFEEAARRAADAIGAAPEEPSLRILHGRALEMLGRSAPAAAEFRRALAIDPEAAGAREGLARLSQVR